MKKLLFVTNFASPYRVDFCNELGRTYDLTVVYERAKLSNRDDRWTGDTTRRFIEVYLDLKPRGNSESVGVAVARYIKENTFDMVLFSGYASPAVIVAILYCKLHRIPYCIEFDGGYNKREAFHKRCLKKVLVSSAKGLFITCRDLYDYLCDLGVPPHKLHTYPFSSVKRAEILEHVPTENEKEQLKAQLGIPENKTILAVGRFIPLKGFDILLEALQSVDNTVGVYLIGGEPPAEYLAMKERYQLSNVHFVDFMDKATLQLWYRAADLLVHPTRKDIWGLVINEAMACGLPVISTDRCIAATELITDGENGYVVPVGDAIALSEKIQTVMQDDALRAAMSENSLKVIAPYTTENMAQAHADIFKEL